VAPRNDAAASPLDSHARLTIRVRFPTAYDELIEQYSADLASGCTLAKIEATT